ncbi:hypothetical protein HMF8227_02335 [Saliniradius amylolyticus]|uniref:Toprim domain-containing protein n=2 Tax=Saliniradius amylolyticus TaxID=2183582 RepID=A0A2S2E745_9ALTE|nr:hypothetical protein HMF8227_02335 [Saliniradius amylolyticus]
MASANDLKQRIDLHDLATRLGMERPDPSGNYRSPHRKDQNPSLSIWTGNDGMMRWKDHAGDAGGSCIDLVMYVEGLNDSGQALSRLHEIYGIEPDRPEAPKEKTQIEWVADQVLANPGPAKDYLVNERKLSAEVVDYLIARKAVGHNDWRSTQKQAGEQGHGGPAVSFIARCLHTNRVVGIDNRYFDKELNGGLKTKSQGEKMGHPWVPDLNALKRAKTVYVVESAINAASIISAFDPKATGKVPVTAVALRGLAVDTMDFRFLQNKFVVVCMDNDPPVENGPMKGRRPGPEAGWEIYEALSALNIPCLFVDHAKWPEGVNDVNDLLQQLGPATTMNKLRCYENWLIQGFPGSAPAKGCHATHARRRVTLPDHDFAVYWQYRVRPDFSSFVKLGEDEEGNEKKTFHDLAGFRIAALSRVTITSATAALTGESDSQPNTVFAASVQVPRHPGKLIRRVMQDEQLHNIDQWKRFGPIFRPAQFARMLNILERTTHMGGRDALNFVGIAWKQGKPVLNEGPDCYFSEPDKQCPYHNLSFPSGPVHQAKPVIEAYAKTMQGNSALTLLVWALGAHLKTFIGKWPHMVLQADKGTGKSTLIKRLERSIAFTMFSGQSLKSEFRLLTSISHTTHPVGWEELSAQGKRIIDLAVAQLQESYNYTVTRRGSDMLEYVLIAPVLLAGEDVPVDSLLGKVVRADLNKGKGALIPESLPRFPVKEWLQFITRYSREQVSTLYHECIEYMEKYSMAAAHDNGATRMRDNYACLLMAWRLLSEFADVPSNYNGFHNDLIQDMNSHIKETDSDREPWIWIMELILGELDAGHYRHPSHFDTVEETFCLLIRPSHIMQHIGQSPALKHIYDGLPVKSARVLKKQLLKAGVVVKDGVEKTINGRRISNMLALSIEELQQFGLAPSVPDGPDKID